MSTMQRLQQRIKRSPRSSTQHLPQDYSPDIVIHHHKQLGEGTFGTVYEGIWMKEKVAIKVLEKGVSLSAIQHDAQQWKGLQHRHLLQLIEETTLDEQPILICGYKANRNAIEYLRQNPRADRVRILYEAAIGLSYLHQHDVVHGNLKGNNILVDSTGQACLSDLGLSHIKYDPATSRRPGASNQWSLRWMGPEQILTGSIDKATDIYSFGMTMYEIFTGLPPFPGLPNDVLLPLICDRASRPPRPRSSEMEIRGLDDAMWDLIMYCWCQKPENRPTIDVVAERLEMFSKVFASAQHQNSTHLSSDPHRLSVNIRLTERSHRKHGHTLSSASSESGLTTLSCDDTESPSSASASECVTTPEIEVKKPAYPAKRRAAALNLSATHIVRHSLGLSVLTPTTPYTPFRSGSLDDADGEYRATLARKHRSQFLTAEAKCSDDSTIELKSPGVLNACAPLRTPGPFTTSSLTSRSDAQAEVYAKFEDAWTVVLTVKNMQSDRHSHGKQIDYVLKTILEMLVNVREFLLDTEDIQGKATVPHCPSLLAEIASTVEACARFLVECHKSKSHSKKVFLKETTVTKLDEFLATLNDQRQQLLTQLVTWSKWGPGIPLLLKSPGPMRPFGPSSLARGRLTV